MPSSARQEQRAETAHGHRADPAVHRGTAHERRGDDVELEAVTGWCAELKRAAMIAAERRRTPMFTNVRKTISRLLTPTASRLGVATQRRSAVR